MKQKIILCVSAVVEGDDGRILLLKRAAHDSFPNKWELPGGKVEFGEDPSVAIARELEEETGIFAAAFYPVNTESIVTIDNSAHLIRIIYKCIPIPPQIIMLSEEHFDYKWVDSSEIEY